MPAARRSATVAAPNTQHALQIWAWAKINLYLHVVGRRADGYHELDSLIVFAGVGDRLRFAAADALSLTIEGPFGSGLAADESNLVLRAAHALRDSQSIEDGARLALDKRLPLASGIGGGSADAAATLIGLARLWRIAPGEAALSLLAARLGADVPVCLFGRPAFIGGIGEVIERAPPLPPAWLLLVNPGVELATPAVFKRRQGAFSQTARWRAVDRDAAALAERLAETRNDLEASARSLVPEIGEVLSAIGRQPGCLLARLSGSGATCFGLFAEQSAAQAAAASLAAAQPEWWSAAAPLLHGRLDRPWWGDGASDA
ncbi:MAG: 4-(cytidine 5'-diphospho)-2-C-methyl-D-erythritol kinase [Kiloniellales bacterium]